MSIYSIKALHSISTRCLSTVGFIGLGNMGGFMAKNLIKGGQSITVFDVNDDAVADLKNHGATVSVTPQEVASQSDVIVTMVPSSPHVTEVFCGDDGILKSLKPGTLCIDSSTIDPTVSKSIHEKVKIAGGHFYDAPVSGGVVAAENGALTFMVGGEEKRFGEVKSYLDHMGANVVHCGTNGNGLVVKLCNNMMLAISMIGASETLNMGIKMGMDKKLLSDIMAKSTARCWSIDTYNPVPDVLEGVPASRDYAGGFGAKLMLKDLGLAQSMALDTNSPILLGSMAKNLYEILCQDEEFAPKDFGVMFKYLQERK